MATSTARSPIFMNEFAPYAKQMRQQSAQFSALQAGLMAESIRSVRSAGEQAIWVTIGMFVACLALVGVVVVIVRRINQDLRLTAESLSQGAEQIAAVATQTSANSQSLAKGVSAQAASIEETSSAAEEISSMARQNADNSQAAAALVPEERGEFCAGQCRIWERW